MVLKYLVHVYKWYSDHDTYSFDTKEQRQEFIENLPDYHKENKFYSLDVKEIKNDKK